FQAFVQNYNMQSMEKKISEVHSLLIEFEKSIKRNRQPIVGASSTPQVMAIQGGRVQKYKPQGIYTIELFAFFKNSWVYDTGCGTHICNTKQGLRGAKKLKRGRLYLYVGNGNYGLLFLLPTYYFYYPPESKIVVERYANFLENDFILQKESERIVELEDEDILPSENTREHPIEEEILAPIVSQEEDVIPVRRS
nr:hypothetical protein [Tanacetum cinerariifolium]